MEEFRYCQVHPKGYRSVYSYISDEEILIGSYVEVPFGRDNDIVKGKVLEVGMFTEETAPFPVERTKKILRVISEEEYLADDQQGEDYDMDEDDWDEDFDGEDTSDDEYVKRELEKAQRFLEENAYGNLFEWACAHHEDVESPEMMRMVVRCYSACVEQNDPTAALNLGTLYYTGQGVKQDYQKAAALYEIAAAAGHKRAICNLGYCWYYGRHADVDYEKALHYFNLGAVLFNDPNCLYKLGDMYDQGLAVEQNRTYAVKLYQRALDACETAKKDWETMEDAFCLADVQLRVGQCWLAGDVLKKDPSKALQYLHSALEGFYKRRKTDPFVGGLITKTKGLIRQAEAALDKEVC